jgi:cytochrome c-type biogenesis protein CcmE
MKKSHIIILLVIAVCIGIVFFSLNSSETYANFTESDQHRSKTYHVVGTLNRDKDIVYDPKTDANLFTFFLVDKEGVERKVFLHKAKPQDFDKSEQIVVIGKMQDDGFHAKDLLTKCPSKYSDAKTTEVN